MGSPNKKFEDALFESGNGKETSISQIDPDGNVGRRGIDSEPGMGFAWVSATTKRSREGLFFIAAGRGEGSSRL